MTPVSPEAIAAKPVWWATDEYAESWDGPYPTEADARLEAIGQGIDSDVIWIAHEYDADPLDYIDSDVVIDSIDDDCEDIQWTGKSLTAWWGCTVNQTDDLTMRLRLAFSEWMDANGFTFPICVKPSHSIRLQEAQS